MSLLDRQLAVARHDCDSDLAALLDGTLAVGDLAHEFADADGNRRGIRARWRARSSATAPIARRARASS
jgi:hypothetical protein